jgi:hypothetical protein
MCRGRVIWQANGYHHCIQWPTIRQKHARSCETAWSTKDIPLSVQQIKEQRGALWFWWMCIWPQMGGKMHRIMSWTGSMKLWFTELYNFCVTETRVLTVELLRQKREADINFQGSYTTLTK